MSVAVALDDPDRAFLEYWREHLLDPRDSQNDRWLAIERGQIERGARMANDLGRRFALAGARVLEIGCQTGALSIGLAKAGARSVGLDVGHTLLRAAAIRARGHGAEVDFVVGRAEALPFAPSSFDVVTMIDVLEHVDGADASMYEMSRVLRPGGTVIVQAPNRFAPRWMLSDPHYRLAGISVLPAWLARPYVTRVRRRPRFDVATFPVGGRVVRVLKRLNIGIVESPRPLALWFGGMFTLVGRKSL